MHLTVSRLLILGLVLLSLAVGVLLYPRMPALVASHWNDRGQMDGYMPRFWVVFIILPVMGAALYSTVYSYWEFRRLSKES